MSHTDFSSSVGNGCGSPATVRPLAFGPVGFFLPGLAGLESLTKRMEAERRAKISEARADETTQLIVESGRSEREAAHKAAELFNTNRTYINEAAKLKEERPDDFELDKSKHYATVKRMELIHHGVSFNWRLLKSTSAEMGLPAVDVFDQNYGTVKAYHADVWREAYALSINPVGVA